MPDKKNYVGFFRGNPQAAAKFEQMCLEQGNLPECAIAVAEGLRDPDPDYWLWLIANAKDFRGEKFAEAATAFPTFH